MPHILKAISPVDGRYRKNVDALSEYFSEYALIKYRIYVEIQYLIALKKYTNLAELHLSDALLSQLNKWSQDLQEEDILAVKEIEKTTNHDVKAVEYHIKNKIKSWDATANIELVHLGLTSQDINNTAVPLSIKNAMLEEYFPLMDQIIRIFSEKAYDWKDIPMLAHTHGQPASPTLLGKEINVFYARLTEMLDLLRNVKYAAKFSGATGNFNSLYFAYPEVNWHLFGKQFVEEQLQLSHSYPTTQIEHYDHLAALFDNIKRINTILLDFVKDMWSYISMEYFKQKIKAGEVGSSAMPHKINPIDFENAEGNLGIANALFEHLSSKLPISRLQRDLTDSTVLRNIGVPFAHSMIAYKSILRGMDKLILNEERINDDLENNWAVIAEGIQTLLKRNNYPNPYEVLKELTRRNEKITSSTFITFIENLDILPEVKEKLKSLSPQTYTGRY